MTKMSKFGHVTRHKETNEALNWNELQAPQYSDPTH